MLADDWGLVIWILEVAGHLGEIAKGGGGRRRSLFLDELVVKWLPTRCFFLHTFFLFYFAASSTFSSILPLYVSLFFDFTCSVHWNTPDKGIHRDFCNVFPLSSIRCACIKKEEDKPKGNPKESLKRKPKKIRKRVLRTPKEACLIWDDDAVCRREAEHLIHTSYLTAVIVIITIKISR